ncbi:[acyl-carrier-protein] S-malonyltransferase [Corallincola luteus]|uniref:Malonyl CoA-acyl carrier protein transacylase n=2 Tax=Corallincola TaxID=1775176 RepID=A0A368NS97_9GAMM|nr:MULTISPECIES: ACP S-malonyltransferase [Corallincola]RCU52564.1 [acyl-carrier-protein] S-malonyltransferase [Corallincola holothuriorum]TCI02462.1 [acyl-carrier-protein] S-malonyltransferase [Corallincola luteus]
MSNKFAFVFPGQGSQTVGMLADLANNEVVQATFAEASAVLGYDLWKLVSEGPVEDLNQTDRTQPALLASSVALFRLWQSQGGEMPSVMAGHSLGEYSALVCAGVLSFVDAIKLVEQRGKFMQQAVPAGEGAMSAIIGLSDEEIISACEKAAENEVVSAVNFNSPGQVVIAGSAAAVARANELCKEAGAKRALPLPVSVPSHCALMKPAAEQLATSLDSVELATPVVPVVNNVDVAQATDAAEIRDALVRQLHKPVRWTESVQSMVAGGVTEFVEVGPGKVLSGLIKRIDRSATCVAVNDFASLENALTK